DDAPRCPNCGKRVSADAAACAACGYELVTHRQRMRCSHCGSRIPAASAKCPRCGADPRASRIPRAVRLGAVVLALLLLVCVGWVIFRAITTNVLARALGLNEPTRVPTQVINVIYVVASPIPVTPTLTPSATATPTSRFSPTPTRRGARTPTLATPAAGATIAPGFYAAPQLVAPLNATVYEGANSVITLQWQPVSPNGLRENEWYYITITFTASDRSQSLRTGWSKETRWTVPAAWWNDAASDARAFKWTVAVMRVEGIDPLISPNKTPASPNSAVRTFFWN
ncbi:MAG TPA: zinc-ribbon domain-containing protein, partial [Anaerolineae bacterium]